MEPTYDFIYGGSQGPGGRDNSNLRQTLRQSKIESTDPIAADELRARVRTLEYESAQWKKDKEMLLLRHQKELSDAQNKADADFRRAQAAEGSAKTSSTRYESLANELREERERFATERSELERKVRTASGQRDTLQEELDDAQEQLSSRDRDLSRKLSEATARQEGLQKSYNQLQEDFEGKTRLLQNAQQKLSTQEDRIGELEAELLQIKSESEEAGTVSLLRRELSEQVAHIRKLEEATKGHNGELEELRKFRTEQIKLDSELSLLRNKVRNMDAIQEEAQQALFRSRALEAEKEGWTSYLQSQEHADRDIQIETPEDLARAYMRERISKTSLEQNLGTLQTELNSKDAAISTLEQTQTALQEEITKLKGSANGPTGSISTVDNKVKARLERQRVLASKEADYLRAQLKAIESEEFEDGDKPERYTEQTNQRISGLESVLDEHRKEIEALNQQLAESEKELQKLGQIYGSAPAVGTKRPLDENADERLGEMLRKNRHLQNELGRLQSKHTILENESKAQLAQISTLKQTSRTKILEFRDNPTARAEKIKQRTLEVLTAENATLRAQLDGSLPTKSSTIDASDNDASQLVPRGSLDALQLTLEDKDTTIASREKSLTRLKDIFRAKGAEFVEAVYSLLGWKLDFLPNGRVNVRSMYYPGSAEGRSQDRNDIGEEKDHFIMFDGEAGTMKVSGGPQSEFAKEIKGLLDFWVEGRGSVPCLLAAMTLEFWERYQDQAGGG